MIDMKTALILSLLGTLLLLFLSNNLEPKITNLKDISISDIDNFVKIEGEVMNVKIISNMTLIEVKDNSDSINVVLFEKAELSKGMQIEILGKVSEFNNEVQINAERIILR